MPAESLKNKTVKGVIWSSVERFSVQGVQFLVMLVIARLLGKRPNLGPGLIRLR